MLNTKIKLQDLTPARIAANANQQTKQTATHNHSRLNVAGRSLLAGGIAGICAKTTVAPLDRIKILMQAQNAIYKNLGVVSGLREMVKRESVVGLYRGNGAQAVRIFPYSGIQFFSFELYKSMYGSWLNSQANQANHMQKVLAGGSAGATAVVLTYPLDLVRARITFQVKNRNIVEATKGPGFINRSAILSTMVNAVKNEGGVKALYKGMSATLIAMIPYNACNFYTVDSSKRLVLSKYPHIFGKKDPVSGELSLKTQSRLALAAMSAAVANTVGYPLDVARRRMQLGLLSKDTAKFSENAFKTLKLIYKENGITKGLYKGLSINYLRVVPLFAVQYAMNDNMKELLGLSTS